MTQMMLVLQANERRTAARARLDLQVVATAAGSLFSKGASAFSKFAASLESAALGGKAQDAVMESRRRIARKAKGRNAK